MKTTLAALTVLGLLLPSSSAAIVVGHVLQGDLVRLTNGTTVRYAGVAVPPVEHEIEALATLGRKARDLNQSLVFAKNVRVEVVSRTDDEVRAFVFVGETFVNAELIGAGYAKADPHYVGQYRDLFRRLEITAHEARVGLWADDSTAAWMPSPPEPEPEPVSAGPRGFLRGGRQEKKGPTYTEQSPWLNPDGPPGSWALEPYGWYSGNPSSDQYAYQWAAGARLLMPTSNSSTVFVDGRYSELRTSGFGQIGESFFVGVAVRLWIHGTSKHRLEE